MAIVSVAITVSFHIKGTPSDLERRVAKPLGGIFWVLSVVTLVLGVGSYISKWILFAGGEPCLIASFFSSLFQELSTCMAKELPLCNLVGRHKL